MPISKIKSSGINDDAITSAKIADDAVDTTDIASDAITTDKLDDSAGGVTMPGVQYLKLPVGSTAQRPGSPANGHLRYNTDFARIEQYADGSWIAIDTPPTITSVTYPNSQTGVDPAGGETFIITGTSFQSGVTVTLGGTSASTVTVDSVTQITITTPAKSAGDYDIVVTNSNGLSATLTNGIAYNGIPAFTTAADLGTISGETSISSLTIVATEPDGGTLSYSISTPASPDFVSINSSTGALSGTTPAGGLSETAYNFGVTATDDENQTATRTYTLTVLAATIYSYNIPQSLMFNYDDNQYITWTPDTTGNRRTWTLSFWAKLVDVQSTHSQRFFASGNDGNGDLIKLEYYSGTSTRQIALIDNNHASTGIRLTTDMEFRDPAAWYHIVYSIDTTQATESNRAKVYVNGTQVTDWVHEIYPDQNYQFNIPVSGQSIQFGRGFSFGSSTPDYWDGYLTEINFIDGTALSPTSFGEEKEDVWIPKEYTGSYGTNGFHLPMTNDTSVEGFNTVTWYGDATVGKVINGVGFEPDFVWIKERSSTSSHHLYDQNRGLDAVLFSDSNLAESTTGSQITSYSSDGFTINDQGGMNQDGQTYVAWCWKAGDSNVSNTDGSITSQVSANSSYGFSIATYTGTGVSGATVGHGLSQAPEAYLVFNRSTGTNHTFKTTVIDGTLDYAFIDTSAAFSGAGESLPTSSVFYPSTASNEGSNGNNYVAYFFHSVSGYSDIGTYSGTGSAGNSVTGLGFEPAWVMIKRTNATGNWVIFDNTRDTENTADSAISADLNDREYTSADGVGGIDFDSDGFTLQDTHTTRNASGGEYFYMAFADTRDNAFWRDESGNGNNWQPVNTGSYRITTDTPTGTT